MFQFIHLFCRRIFFVEAKTSKGCYDDRFLSARGRPFGCSTVHSSTLFHKKLKVFFLLKELSLPMNTSDPRYDDASGPSRPLIQNFSHLSRKLIFISHPTDYMMGNVFRVLQRAPLENKNCTQFKVEHWKRNSWHKSKNERRY